MPNYDSVKSFMKSWDVEMETAKSDKTILPEAFPVCPQSG